MTSPTARISTSPGATSTAAGVRATGWARRAAGTGDGIIPTGGGKAARLSSRSAVAFHAFDPEPPLAEHSDPDQSPRQALGGCRSLAALPYEAASAAAAAGGLTAPSAADEALIARFQRAAFDYFLEQVNPRMGWWRILAARTRPRASPSLDLLCRAIRWRWSAGWMAGQEAAERTLATLRFFRKSEQSEAADATRLQGFLLPLSRHAKRPPRLAFGAVAHRQHAPARRDADRRRLFSRRDTSRAARFAKLAAALYRRVDWRWAHGGAATVRQGWKPDSGFLHYGWEGYSEATLLYVLGLASPTHPLSTRRAIGAWTATYQWENIYDCEYSVCRARFSFTNFRTLGSISRASATSSCVRSAAITFENSCRAITVQREYARRNPHDFQGYDGRLLGNLRQRRPGLEDHDR